MVNKAEMPSSNPLRYFPDGEVHGAFTAIDNYLHPLGFSEKVTNPVNKVTLERARPLIDQFPSDFHRLAFRYGNEHDSTVPKGNIVTIFMSPGLNFEVPTVNIEESDNNGRIPTPQMLINQAVVQQIIGSIKNGADGHITYDNITKVWRSRFKIGEMTSMVFEIEIKDPSDVSLPPTRIIFLTEKGAANILNINKILTGRPDKDPEREVHEEPDERKFTLFTL